MGTVAPLTWGQAAAREGKDRVVLIGIAQEKASVWTSRLLKNPAQPRRAGLRHSLCKCLMWRRHSCLREAIRAYEKGFYSNR